MIDELQPTDGFLILLTADSVEHCYEVYSGAELLDLEIPYGGGTNMSAGLDYIEEQGYSPDLVMVFTDYEVTHDDGKRLVDEGCVIVMDGQPSEYARWVMGRTDPRVITVDDSSLAA